ncbi:MurR/RpiR family transcriptional regulator [Paenibacillus massiliensis]|uniref:MurR/RpiR family transcriptional regulator n=1 Tax=Paenibacillus massiliensis TaxID=225917 RepID=UPI00047163B2|nr:MurR/RpiR family transcriptional regulator [Paenibacillus massiliensis]
MLIQQLKYAENLTIQEQHIAAYVLSNPEAVFTSTAQELAQQTYTSSSTIVRFCKKLGTKGYPDFQLQLALQYPHSPQDIAVYEDGMNAKAADPTILAMDKVPYLYQQAVEQTRRLLSHSELLKVYRWLQECRRIDIYGSDSNYYLGQQASSKWNELGKSSMAYNTVNVHYIRQLNQEALPLSLIISKTGETPAMLEAARQLKHRQGKTVAITSHASSTLAKQCDAVLLLPNDRGDFRLSKPSSMISIMYIFDLLYVCLLDNDE